MNENFIIQNDDIQIEIAKLMMKLSCNYLLLNEKLDNNNLTYKPLKLECIEQSKKFLDLSGKILEEANEYYFNDNGDDNG